MTLEQVLSAAKDTRDPQEYIGRVKTVMRDHLQRLDDTASIEDTRYFNHSAIPDFTMSWPGESGRRNVFLRDSYEAIAVGDDEGYLARLEPVLISLEADPWEPPPVELVPTDDGLEIEKASRPRSLRTLVTDVAAVDVIGSSSTTESPLSSLVRSNFVRGARGHIDASRAEYLVGQASDTADASKLPAAISDSFVEDAAFRINRTARLVALALSPDQDLDLEAAIEASGGRLSQAELGSLLPWLLSQPAAIKNDVFWRELGRLTDLRDLEQLRSELGDLNLSPLIWANASTWDANWAYLGLAAPRTEDDGPRAMWSFAGGRLGYDVEDERVLIAKNGQLIRPRPGTSTAMWDAVAPQLEGYRLAGVTLQGIRRSVTVDAERSDDVRRDIEDVVRSLEDQYLVTSIRVRVAATDGDGMVDIDIDFGAGTVKAGAGASISEMVRAVSRILKHRAPFTPDQLSAMIKG